MKNTPDKNVYEAWRRLHFEFDPQTAGVETSAMGRIPNPKQTTNLAKLSGKIQRWEERIRTYIEMTGDVPINDRTRKDLLIQNCPDKLQEHIRDLLLTNKTMTWQGV